MHSSGVGAPCKRARRWPCRRPRGCGSRRWSSWRGGRRAAPPSRRIGSFPLHRFPPCGTPGRCGRLRRLRRSFFVGLAGSHDRDRILRSGPGPWTGGQGGDAGWKRHARRGRDADDAGDSQPLRIDRNPAASGGVKLVDQPRRWGTLNNGGSPSTAEPARSACRGLAGRVVSITDVPHRSASVAEARESRTRLPRDRPR